MKIHTLLFKLNLSLALGLLGGFAAPAAVAVAGYWFTYQGCLTVDGLIGPNMRFDFRFKLFDAETGGNQIGGDDRPDVIYFPAAGNYSPTSGTHSVLFTVPLDFGADAFIPAVGDYNFPGLMPRWLQIEVRPADTNPAAPYTLLSPRQPITPTPQALYAATAGTVPAGSLTSTQLTPGAVMTLNLADGAVTSPKIAPGNVLRSLNGLKDDVTLSAGDGLTMSTDGGHILLAATSACGTTYSNCFWNLRGNGNIDPGTHFLGTIAGELAPLEFRVNDNRTMLYTFTGPNDSPNIAGVTKATSSTVRAARSAAAAG